MTAPIRPSGPAIRRLLRLARSSPSQISKPALRPWPAAQSSRWHSTTTTATPPPSSSSVNPDEVSHFNALAADWWDLHGSSRLLHLMNPLRHDFITSCRRSTTPAAASPPEGLSYLDIGCGGGIFAESAARLPTTARVLAIDPTPSVLAVAKGHARRDPALASKLEYRQTSIEELPIPSRGEAYDVVSLFEVIEHVDEPARFLDKVRPFVRPGGWLVMSTVARTWVSWFTTNFMAEDVLGIVPKGTHDWNKYINEEELRRYFVDKKGWVSPRVMGVIYVPGVGWKEVAQSERVGNYFFAIRREEEA